ncbi:putative immunity protein [Sporolactobacillus sp. STCC-11]|uniref:putative immunity protein n=1 Tax=Sporolactobacillus caesalpiniae TaxID=3230362 RepID=UPI00339AB1BF
MKFVDTERKKEIDAKLKLVKQQTAALWAAVCSDHVIRYFEQERPHDERPRQAIAAARSLGRDNLLLRDFLTNQAHNKTHFD